MITFWKTYVEKHNFYSAKQPIDIIDVDNDHVLVSDKYIGKINFSFLTGLMTV